MYNIEMKHKGLIASLLVGTVLVATAAKDPVLMKINGKEIKLSEFEYLYNKNKQQQLEAETLDQYVDRFVTYKLKVADAEAAGIDTLQSFQNEFKGYKTDIIKPFLEDTTVIDRLVQEAYQNKLRQVDIDHFMYSLGKNYAENLKNMAFVDSIRQCILNGEDWSELAQKYSVDPSVRRNNGHYGFINGGAFPYEFEKVAFSTPVGEISKPFRTDYGFHMVRVNAERPDAGEIHAQHILKLFPRVRVLTDSMKVHTKARIDSVYMKLQAGADFSELAKLESEDPGSAKNGGELPWFGRGRMVPEFEKIAFELADGEMSQPFETSYGYHIIKKLGSRPTPSLEEQRKGIEQRIKADSRRNAPRLERIKQLKQQYNYKVSPNLHKYLTNAIAKHGQYDSTFVVNVLANSNEPLFTFAKKTVPVSVLAPHLSKKLTIDNASAVEYIESFIENKSNDEIMQYYADNIINDTPEYRNLLNEYRDGMMLFEISNRRVWEGASRDTLGLNKYFEANRTKYDWDAPRFKGVILNAVSDSVFNAVKADIAAMSNEPFDSITTSLHAKYANDIKMERMPPMARGENKTVDYLFFNGPAPEGKYPYAMVIKGGLISRPETLADVRGQVTSDYQDVLEKRWVEELKAKYPVVIDKKVLKKVK